MPMHSADFLKRLDSAFAHQLQDRINIFESIDSTNNYLADATEPAICIAWQQHAGRGRGDKTWLSHPAGSLSFTLAWIFSNKAVLNGLSLACGMALVDCFRSLGLKPCVKWPNDLLVKGEKIAGILVELHRYTNKVTAVIGIGINLAPPNCNPDLNATSLSQHLTSPPDRIEICAAIANLLFSRLTQFSSGGFALLQPEWNKHHCWNGFKVCVTNKNQKLTGKCLGVDSSGGLMLATNKGLAVVHSGSLLLTNSK